VVLSAAFITLYHGIGAESIEMYESFATGSSKGNASATLLCAIGELLPVTLHHRSDLHVDFKPGRSHLPKVDVVKIVSGTLRHSSAQVNKHITVSEIDASSITLFRGLFVKLRSSYQLSHIYSSQHSTTKYNVKPLVESIPRPESAFSISIINEWTRTYLGGVGT
jgi:hypothetical protein